MIAVCTICTSGCIIVEKEESLFDRVRNVKYELERPITEVPIDAYGDYSGIPVGERSPCSSSGGSDEARRLLNDLRHAQGVRQVFIEGNIVRVFLTDLANTEVIDSQVHNFAHQELVA